MQPTDARLMIVDDDESICEILSRLLELEGFKISIARNGENALQMIPQYLPDVMLLDLAMPGKNGMDVLKEAKTLDPDLPVVMITAHADIHGTVEAMRAGAHDYLAKPFEHPEIIRVVHRALAERRLKQKLKQLSLELGQSLCLSETMGPSDKIRKLISAVNQVAKSNFSVVIIGETGAGKELVAQTIHRVSQRSKGPFVAIDCGAIPETLLESELFGHAKGAFTGAAIKKEGKFKAAKGGTLFLDEIANMPLNSQAKLLRAVQDKKITPVGSVQPLATDVRLLTACNQDLENAVTQGTFREDLYYRLNEFTIKIPPLREREEDIPYLAKRFLDSTNIELNKQVIGFSEAAIDHLLAFSWPGNVRQLRSVIRRAVLLADDIITENHFNLSNGTAVESSDLPASPTVAWEGQSLKHIVNHQTKMLERKILSQVLKSTGGNKAKAARLLQIDYKTIQTKIKKLSITANGENNG